MTAEQLCVWLRSQQFATHYQDMRARWLGGEMEGCRVHSATTALAVRALIVELREQWPGRFRA